MPFCCAEYGTGKRQLNQLITFLDKAGNAKEASRADNALRTVRAKRDAEDAGELSTATLDTCVLTSD